VLGYHSLLTVHAEREGFATLARGTTRVIEKNTSLAHDEIGVSVWVVQGPKGFRRLERRALDVAEPRQRTPVVWTKGKGVIGACWARNESIFADLEKLRQQNPRKRTFCELPRDQRFRFGWREFRDTRRYKAILAVPLRPRIYGRYRVRGVLSIDVTVSGKGEELERVSEIPGFSGIIRTCEALLAQGLEE
jgi:hypothetical protein